MQWYIGLSGFHYREWKGVFYPEGLPQRRWFEHYCTQFNTLELNSTFYRFPEVSTLKKWFDQSPDEFKFAVKVPRDITHYKRFNDCTDLVTSFYDTLKQGLQHKLGPVLFQLPPSFSYTEERLQKVIAHTDNSFINVIEFRHHSWWQPHIFDTLTELNIIFSGVSHPKLPEDNPVINTDVAYYRFHGVPVMFSSSYSPEFIQHITQQLKTHPTLQQCWIYFNNTMHTAAIENARTMLGLLA